MPFFTIKTVFIKKYMYIGNKDSYNNDIFGNIIYQIKEESAIPINLFKKNKK